MVAKIFKRTERGFDLAAGTGLRTILIILALALSLQSGRMATTVRGSMLLVVSVAVVSIALVILMKPRLVLWLLPAGVTIPRTAPRLFGRFGLLELVLALGAMALLMHLVIHRKRIYTDWFFKVMLLAALPIGSSWLLGRGEGDGALLYIWLGACLAYLLAINLVTGKREPYRVLDVAAIIVVGLLVADVWLKGTQKPWETDVPWVVYRQAGTTVGMGNFAMTLMAMVLPVLLAYGIVVKNRVVRWMNIIVFLVGTTVAISFLTRIVIISLIVSVLAMSYMLRRRKGAEGRKIARRTALMAVLPLAIVQLWAGEIIDAFADRFARIYYAGDPRFEIWRGQFEIFAASPLWGYGSINTWERFGVHGSHGLYLRALYEYGLVFMIPLAVLLVKWFANSWRLVQRDGLDNCRFAFALANWGVVTGVLITTIPVPYIYAHGAYATLAFFTAGLLATQLRMLDERVDEL